MDNLTVAAEPSNTIAGVEEDLADAHSGDEGPPTPTNPREALTADNHQISPIIPKYALAVAQKDILSATAEHLPT